MEFSIGIPQAIYLGLTLFGLIVIVANDGKPRTPYDATGSVLAYAVIFGLLYWGGFFS